MAKGIKITSTWPAQWYANGMLQNDEPIRLTDEQIKQVTALISKLNKENQENGN